MASPEEANVDHTAFKNQQCWDILVAATGHMPTVRAEVPCSGAQVPRSLALNVEISGTMVSESLGLTSHKSSCNCTGCGMLRAGVCINCAEKTTALILESGPRETAVEPCSGACREAIELYFSTPPERWRAPLSR